MALDEYLDNPRSFYSPRRASLTAPAVRRRESLLGSLEKMGRRSAVELTASLDILSALTDEELDTVDVYARELATTSNLDTDEAYAMALDAYIQGIEASKRFSQSCPTTPQAQTSTSTSLDRKRDMELVSIYAKELEENAYFSEYIAFGIALDTYLADPDGFRRNISGTSSTACNQYSWDTCVSPMTPATQMENVEAEGIQGVSTPVVPTPVQSVEVNAESESEAMVAEDVEVECEDAPAVVPTPVQSTAKKTRSNRKRAAPTPVAVEVDAEAESEAVVEDEVEVECEDAPAVVPTPVQSTAKTATSPVAVEVDAVSESEAMVEEDVEVVCEEAPAVVPTPVQSTAKKTRSSRKRAAPSPVAVEADAEEAFLSVKRSRGRGKDAAPVEDSPLEEDEEEEEALAILCDG